MAEIRPFNALRFTPKAGDIQELTCPPYDIISEAQRKQYIERNPYNIVRLELPRDGTNPYAVAGETLNEWLDKGILASDDKPGLYIYEIRFELEGRSDITGIEGGKHSVMGLVGLVKLEEFEKGVILPHEHTLSKAKTDRLNLMKATACNFSSIYALYNDDGGEQETLDIMSLASREQPICEMTDADGLEHRLWEITDEAVISYIQNHMANMKLYIADGHHRYETALNYRNYARAQGVAEGAATDYVMMVMVDMNHPGLVVFPTHRLIHGIDSLDIPSLLDSCKKYFYLRNEDISALDESLENAYLNGEHAFGLYTGGSTFTLLTLRDSNVMNELLPSLSPASRNLDVTILHTLILERLLNIDRENMAQQKNLTYTRDISKAIDGVASGDYQCAFVLNPTRVTEIKDVASAGEKMPQKSTYFYPKLITGLVMNKLN